MNTAPDKTHIQRLAQQGQLNEAKTACRKLLKLNKYDAELFYTFGTICGQLEHYKDAIFGFKKAAELAPHSVEAHYNMGIALQATGKQASAIKAFKKALKIQPTLAIAYFNMGNAFHTLGDIESAKHAFQKTTEIQPEHINAQLNLASMHVRLEEPDIAIRIYQRILTQHPELSDAHLGIGVAYQMAQKLDLAIQHLTKAVDLNPRGARAHTSLGKVWQELGNIEKASNALRKAINLDNHNANTWTSLGYLQLHRGDSSGALQAYEKACKIAPDSPQSHVNLASAFLANGQIKEAEKHARRAYTLDPELTDAITLRALLQERIGNVDAAQRILSPCLLQDRIEPSIAILNADICIHQKKPADAIPILKKSLNQPQISNQDQRQINFTLGKILDLTGKYDAAYTYYQHGNKLKNAQFSPDSHSQLVNRIIKIFSADYFSRAPQADNCGTRMVFIVGMPRSGTSLVEQILASHPEIHGAGELTIVHNVTSQLPSILQTTEAYPECVELVTDRILNKIAKRYLKESMREASSNEILIDKLPQNFMHLGLINSLFPEARIIHCMRNPMDTCLSCYFQDFMGHVPYAYNLDDLGRFYLDYRRLMQHWISTISNPIYTLAYENVIDDIEGSTRDLLEFCGIDWSDQCLKFYESKRLVRTASHNQVRQPLYRTSVERWKNYQTHMGALLDHLKHFL